MTIAASRNSAPTFDVDAVVIGSGPNGLAAAITLALEGLDVVVYERGDSPGGGVRTAELTLPGFLHDVCSSVYPLAVASPFLRSLPLAERGLRWIHPPVPLAHPLDDGRVAVLHRSLEATCEGLGTDGEPFRRLFGRLAQVSAPLLDAILSLPRPPRSAWGAWLRFATRALRSAAGLAESHFATREARALFAGNAAHAIVPLDFPGSAAIGMTLTLAGLSVGWPVAAGGAGSVVGALLAQLHALGGEVRCRSEIRSLDELPSARAYFLDLSIGRAIELAGSRWPASYASRLRRLQGAPGIFKIDWALDRPIPWNHERCAQAGTVHLGGGLEAIRQAEQAVWNGTLPPRPFVIVAQPSLFDPSRAPAPQHTAWAYCHVPRGSSVDMTAAVEAEIERCADGFGRAILARSVSGPRRLEEYNPNYEQGDITGGANTLFQLLARPVVSLTPWATPDPRLFLCSSSTPPGGGVHGMCGYMAARAALRRGLS